jgi:hypothetical protein
MGTLGRDFILILSSFILFASFLKYSDYRDKQWYKKWKEKNKQFKKK